MNNIVLPIGSSDTTHFFIAWYFEPWYPLKKNALWYCLIMMKSKNNFSEIILTFFLIQITEKLFPAFQHFKTFNVYVLCFSFEMNAPNNMPILGTLSLEKKKKQSNYF